MYCKLDSLKFIQTPINEVPAVLEKESIAMTSRTQVTEFTLDKLV